MWKAIQPEESVHSRVPTVLQPNSGKKPEAELKLEKSAFEFSPKDAFDQRGGSGILRLSVLVAAEKNKKPHIIVLKSNEKGIEEYRINDSSDIKLKTNFLKDTIEACEDIYPEALSLKEVQEKIEKAKKNGAVLIKLLQDVKDKTIANMLKIIDAMIKSPVFGIRESDYEMMDAHYRKLNTDDTLPQEFKDAVKHLVEFAKEMPRPSVGQE